MTSGSEARVGSGGATSRHLRVAIDARLPDGVAGGVQQTLIGLATGLSEIAEDGEEYLFLAFRDSRDWLTPYVRGRCRILDCERPHSSRGWRGALRRAVPLFDRAAFAVAARMPMHPPRSDGASERAGADLVHLALQQGFVTALPTIYVPHDLQHRHLPDFFSRFELRWRDALYPTLCLRAAKVVALSRWGKKDLIEQLGVDEPRIHVIGWAPVLDAYPAATEEDVRVARTRFQLPDAFALYPAQAYPHKNHVRLLEALALLRDRDGLHVPLVCCGAGVDTSAAIHDAIRRLALEPSARTIGFVKPGEIRALYATSRLLVFPSLFEGFGMPVVEAFRAGIPVACSNLESLSETAGDAALRFDPERPSEIAAAVSRLWTGAALRAELVRRGRERVATSTWTNVARTYRALYRTVAGRPLDDADEEALRRTR
jgi:glycosyltransferase involved in cell wall biosynthesis